MQIMKIATDICMFSYASRISYLFACREVKHVMQETYVNTVRACMNITGLSKKHTFKVLSLLA